MPANKLNYIVLFEGSSQVYGAGSKSVAQKTEPPDGFDRDSKRVLFITMEPDTQNMVVKMLPQEEAYDNTDTEEGNEDQ